MLTGDIIYGILGASTAVKALVSTRIYPHIAEQGVVQPFITFQTLQRLPTDTKGNASSLDTYQFEITIVSNNYTTACTICEAVRDELDQYTGTVNSIDVDSIVYDQGTEAYIDDANVFAIIETYNMRVRR
jgi:hypothetical protein